MHSRLRLAAAALAAAVTSYADELPFANVAAISVEAPQGWRLVQKAEYQGTRFAIFDSSEGTFAIYARPQSPPAMRTVFATNGATVVAENEAQIGPLKWTLLQTTAKPKDKPSTTVSISAFRAEHRGITYEGYARAREKTKADAIVRKFLGDAMVNLNGRSLTDEEFGGKKYYLGWGAAAGGDPSMMHNEVKYDVLHTHDVFTEKVGGDYDGVKLIAGQATASSIRNELSRLKSSLRPEDMYVQYSSGHGMQTGIALGLSYSEMRDHVLAMPAKELVVFIMACYSGGLVNAFNQKKSQWENFPQDGRSLFVMSSSTGGETSATGPGTDPSQPGAPNGSAGSAYGHALWKALAGQADGLLDGVADGFLSLEEIRDYTVWRTKQIGGHTPLHTGSYAGALVMNATPPKAFLARLEGGTENMSDRQIMAKIRLLDRELRVQSE